MAFRVTNVQCTVEEYIARTSVDVVLLLNGRQVHVHVYNVSLRGGWSHHYLRGAVPFM